MNPTLEVVGAPRQESRYPQVGGLAVFGVAIVCLHHWLPPTVTHGVLRGAYGAELLFGLAGFFTTLLALRARRALESGRLTRRTALRNAYLQGALRVLPVYVARLLSILVLGGVNNDAQLSLWTLTYNFHALLKGELSGTLAHLWAPSIAFQFFVVWTPCALFLARRQLIPVAVATIAMGFAARLFLASGGAAPIVLRCAGVTSLDALGSGALVLLLAERFGPSVLASKRGIRALLALAVPWVLWGMALQYDRMGAQRPLWETLVITTKAPLTFAVLALAAAGLGGATGRVLSSRPWLGVARATVATYLLHAFVPLLLRKASSGVPLPLEFLLFGALTVGLGLASRAFFEGRFLRLADRFPLEEPRPGAGEERRAA
jgi:peptidoglycan/LPS O-acetylase OafA/YrhL